MICRYCSRPIDETFESIVLEVEGLTGRRDMPLHGITFREGAKKACSGCWYGGVPLAENLSGVLTVLKVATGSEWFVEHTGGSCFLLATVLGCTCPRLGPAAFDPQCHTRACGAGDLPYMAISRAEGALHGDDHLDAIEAAGGWLVQSFTAAHDPLDSPRSSIVVQGEALPMVAKRLAEELLQ